MKPAAKKAWRFIVPCLAVAVAAWLWFKYSAFIQPMHHRGVGSTEHHRIQDDYSPRLGPAAAFLPTISAMALADSVATYAYCRRGPKLGDIEVDVVVVVREQPDQIAELRDKYTSHMKQSATDSRVFYPYPIVESHDAYESPDFRDMAIHTNADGSLGDDWTICLLFENQFSLDTERATAAIAFSPESSLVVYWASRRVHGW